MRLIRTVRHLRAEQWIGQLRCRVRRYMGRPARPAGTPAPAWPGVRWRPTIAFLAPGPQRNTAKRLLAGEFTFLNEKQALGWPPVWQQPLLPKLWQYNVHYFEFLWALEYPDARNVVRDWIVRHVPGRGRVGWEPYPASLRLTNLCCLFFGRFRERTERDEEFRDLLWRSVFHQANWLQRNMEVHLLGNHLLENGVALALAGSCLAGRAADRWRTTGRDILRRELPRQILEDGGHFERSPMYHSRVLYVLATLLNSGDEELASVVVGPLRRMVRALTRLCHPDGEIALLNDSALGVSNPPDELLAYAARLLGDPPAHRNPGALLLPESGYYGARQPTPQGEHYVVCDAGEIGPDYIPGHAHGDIFSFELSLAGHRVIVDGGTHDYQPSAMRSYCRSTRAHNTVEIEGRDQCEFWGVFRVGRRGRPRDVCWRADAGGFRLGAWHDGYRWLPGRPIHHRDFVWHSSGVLMVRDRIEADRPVAAVSRVHLHPDCEIRALGRREARVRYGGGEFVVIFRGEGELREETSFYCPEFGRKLASRTLAFAARGERIVNGFCVTGLGPVTAFDLHGGARVHARHFGW